MKLSRLLRMFLRTHRATKLPMSIPLLPFLNSGFLKRFKPMPISCSGFWSLIQKRLAAAPTKNKTIL